MDAFAQMSRELGDHAWCTGEDLSLSDLATGTLLFWLDFRFSDMPWRLQYPNLVRLADRLGQRRSFQETVPTA